MEIQKTCCELVELVNNNFSTVYVCITAWAGALVQWLEQPAWKLGNRGLEAALEFMFQGDKMLNTLPLIKIKYCGEPP